MRDAQLQAKVGRLRELMAEAAPQPPKQTQAEADAWRAYDNYISHVTPPALEQSHRARAMRTINRIAIGYGWTLEIQRTLDRHDVCSVAALDDIQLETLHQRMQHLEACVVDGFDPIDTPAAR